MTWVKLKGFDNYEISEDSQIRSVGRWVRPSAPYFMVGKQLYPTLNPDLRYTIALVQDGVSKRYGLSRLVAKQFIPNPENLPVVDHRDGDTMNDLHTNLRWVTQKINILEGFKRRGVGGPIVDQYQEMG